jgi:hypothetical protein
MSPLPVHFLKLTEIELAVSELLRKFSKSAGREVVAPIPVEDILEKHLKVRLEITDLVKLLGTSDVLGAAWFDQGVVRVDERVVDQEGRYCFTIGHELGHWVLHRPQLEAERVAPTFFKAAEPPPTVVCRSSEKKAPAEWQADQFSALLLMPARLVKAAFRVVCGDSPTAIIGLHERRNDPVVQTQWRSIAATVMAEGNFSNVSNEAMRYRLQALDLVVDGAQGSLF